MHDPFHARDSFDTGAGRAGIYRLSKLEDAGLTRVAVLPYSIRVLLEAVLRNCDGYQVTEDDVRRLAAWQPVRQTGVEVPFKPSRVVLQDFSGVPAVVDLAAMRGAMRRLGGDPKRINPLIPVHLVIDHSVQVDCFRSPEALAENAATEFRRNRERYEFLRWGQKALGNFRVVPPGVGIIHQVNLEYLAKCVVLGQDAEGPVALPDTVVGTDSHTTMINGLGVLGWGVGGIEAEAIMLGQPLYMLAPEVIGFELSGQLPPGVTATDLVLTVTQILRAEGVVDKFVEFFGPALAQLKVADRAWWPTWRRSTGPRWASSPSTSKRWPICAKRAAATRKSISSNDTRRSRTCSARWPRPIPTPPSRATPKRCVSTCQRSKPAWPAPSGRTTAWPWAT